MISVADPDQVCQDIVAKLEFLRCYYPKGSRFIRRAHEDELIDAIGALIPFVEDDFEDAEELQKEILFFLAQFENSGITAQ